MDCNAETRFDKYNLIPNSWRSMCQQTLLGKQGNKTNHGSRFHYRMCLDWICSGVCSRRWAFNWDIIAHANVWTVWLLSAVGLCCMNTCSAKDVGCVSSLKKHLQSLVSVQLTVADYSDVSLNLSRLNKVKYSITISSSSPQH